MVARCCLGPHATLHDIGRIGIPDSVLAKAGPLNDEEWSFIRRHTVIGEPILAASPALTDIVRIVRSTHESFDGTGYPDGLRGEGIPIEARIVSVCDGYSSMTSDRSYRPPRPHADALAELDRCRGTQFDPPRRRCLRARRSADGRHLARRISPLASTGETRGVCRVR